MSGDDEHGHRPCEIDGQLGVSRGSADGVLALPVGVTEAVAQRSKAPDNGSGAAEDLLEQLLRVLAGGNVQRA
jgi:hypothetical protein